MSVPPIVFRADASRVMGTGHVMRCLTLADVLADRGWRCGFVCRDHEGHLAKWVKARGHDLWLLPAEGCQAKSVDTEDLPAHANWLGVTWQQDAHDTASVLDMGVVQWLVVDHYGIDARWEKALAPKAVKLMVIDDLADRAHRCDLLLDQNPGRTQADYMSRVPGDCTFLTGTRYALLRKEFGQWRERRPVANRTGGVDRILVTLGGADPDNITGLVLAALSRSGLSPDTSLDIVMGPSSPWLEAVREQARQLRFRSTVTAGATDMAERMTQADLAIGAAGATTWERCCLGLPSLVVAIAENQRAFLDIVASQGLAAVADLADLEGAVRTFIDTMQAQPERYFDMVKQASQAVDGLGAARVADAMTGMLEVTV